MAHGAKPFVCPASCIVDAAIDAEDQPVAAAPQKGQRDNCPRRWRATAIRNVVIEQDYGVRVGRGEPRERKWGGSPRADDPT
ncbi:MAG TPA: hypothetical protein VKV15_07405 [Bryobacteraceae bacterium]|nr:hypothetical protein [Bryobacteraceae bacterium]